MRPIAPHRATATVAGLFLVGVLVGSWVGRAAVARATDPYAGLERFARVLTAIEADYVEPLDTETLIDAAIDGMVDELDPHSRWMSAEAVAELRADTEGSTTGFGVELAVVDGGFRIEKVLADSPAAREGLVAGDRLIAIDGVQLAGMALADVEARMQGERGEIGELTVLREGWRAPQKLSTHRDTVKIPALEVARFDSVLYVRFIDFQRGSALDLAHTLAANADATGLLLDLRDNTGGLLDEAVGVVDLFLDEGTIVSVRGRKDGVQAHHATKKTPARDLPVVVLTNHYSASASEIVAGALRDAGRARLVGGATYGKGSVQQLYRNPDGSALKLTVARYHLTSGTIPAGQGLQPDVPVEVAPTRPSQRLIERLRALELEEEEELLALVASLSDPRDEGVPIRWSLPPVERAEVDPVLRAGLEQLQ